ncbi:MAG: type II secretion system protein GspD [Phycisphaerales bacterium]
MVSLALAARVCGAAQQPATPPMVTTPVPAQPPPPTGGVALSGQVDLARLLDLCSQRLGISIDYDPALLKAQQVTLRSGSGLSDADLWQATNQFLAQKGFTTVRQPERDALSVVKLDEAARSARIEPVTNLSDPDSARPIGGVRAGYRNAVVRLKYLSPKDAADVVRPVLSRSGGGGTAAAPGVAGAGLNQLGPGLVVISDLSTRLDEAIGLLRSQDVAENATVVEEVPAKNMSAAQLGVLVAQVAAKRDAVAGEKLPGEVLPAASGGELLVIAPKRSQAQWRSLIDQLDRREAVETQSYNPKLFAVREVAVLVQQVAGIGGGAGAPGSGGDERSKVLVEEPTGTLLVTATPTQHAKIAELMARLDSVPGEARRPLRAFTIRNRPVSELLAVLQRMIDAGALEATSDTTALAKPLGSGLGVNSAAAPPGTTPLIASPNSPSLNPLGSSRPDSLLPNQNRSVVQGKGGLPIAITADEATSTIIAVGDGRLLQQLEQLIKTLDVRQPQVLLEVVLVSMSDGDALNLGVELEKLKINGSTLIRLSSLFGLSAPVGIGGPAVRQAIEGDGFTGAVIDPGDFSVIVRALQTLSNGRSVSLPRVLVSNNQSASFNSVVQEPFTTALFTSSSTPASTAFGGTSDAGTQLRIKPQIGEGGTLLLDYDISISQFTGKAASASVPPPKQVNSVKSIATIPDGYTVVVGGLEVTTDVDGASQVPLLGSIPLFGALFKNQSHSTSKNKFFVFIKAGVVRGGSMEALRYLSDQQASHAALPSDWPKSEPRVVK